MENSASLTPVREAHRFDEQSLAEYLKGQVEGDFSKLVVCQFEGGQSNPTFHLDAGGPTYVMRKKPPGVLLKSAHAVDREYRVITALADSDVPVPKTYLLCEDESILGTAFFIMENVRGRMISDHRLESLSAEDRSALYDDAIRVMAALHRVDWRAVGLEGFGRPGNYFARQISRWSKQYVASKTDEIAEMESLMQWLPDNIPDGEETTIVHGDYRIGNMLIHSSKPQIVALLDWELSTLGHPLGDLAYLAIYGRHARADGPVPGIPEETEIVDRYCALSHRDAVDHWDFYMAYTMFRAAAIGQGVYKRGLDGNASSQFWRRAGEGVPRLAQQAWALVQGNATT